jgi:hypothetical protein
MKTGTCLWKSAKAMLITCLVTGMVLTAGWQQRTAAAADLVVKISRLERVLDLIDSMGTSDAGQAPTDALRGMLQAVDWIDDDRSIVMSWDKSGERVFSAILVPFREANPNFEDAYNAVPSGDYYILSLPPGKAAAIPQDVEREMAAASREVSASTVSMTLALRQLIAGNREGINNLLQSAAQASPSDQTDPLAPNPEEIRHMLAGLVEAAEQIEFLTLHLDLNENQFSMVAETIPVQGGELSTFLASSGLTTRLDGYQSVHDITFRSRSYDVDAVLEVLDTIFGPIYRKLGINFADLTALGSYFTGETAGGMTYGEEDRVLVECMAVLKNEVDSQNFIKNVYLPWAEEYGRNVTRLMREGTGKPIAAVLTRTPDSTVEGHRVIGMRMKLPVSPMPFGDGQESNQERVMVYEVRTAVAGNLLLMAPDDVRLAGMIRLAGGLKKKTSHGPMMTMMVDMGKYLSSLARFIPGHGIDPHSIPDLGTVSFAVATGTDRMITSAAMETDDIRMMMAYLKRMQPSEEDKQPASAPAPTKPVSPTVAKKSVTAPKQPVVRDAADWMEKGRLAATYGAYAPAIKYYKKALAMGSEESRVYFNVGIAYGELGEFARALDYLSRAIQMESERGAYYYGRGRVYLISGNKHMAMEDFKRAAELGDFDAIQYVEGTREAVE